jgi:NhaA family Na+:H+ antiporter
MDSNRIGGRSWAAFQKFFHSEVSGSLILLACTIIALVWANSPWSESYFDLLHTDIGFSWGDAEFHLSLHHWINDGLMVLFFFVVGLEIKREILVGHLSSFKKALLPVSAAVGGMIVPAVLYAVFNAGGSGASGWGVPMATDIAFALGILALFGKRVPLPMKVFLTALAIADDMGAVLVIALFYTETIRWGALAVAAVLLLVLFLLFQARFRRLGVFISLILGVWLAVFASGIHATVAGILVAMVVPIRTRIEPKKFFEIAERNLKKLWHSGMTADSMLVDRSQLDAIIEVDEASKDLRPIGISLEYYLHPGQAFIVLPLFALFNAGVPLGEGFFETLMNPISLGIVAGLFLGKQIGVTLFSWLPIRLGYADLPEGVTWTQIYGVACLAGVGFTMSLFIGELAFSEAILIEEAKIGILTGSLLSAVWGYLVLWRSLPRGDRNG